MESDRPDEGLARLTAFFPTAPPKTVRSVIRAHPAEHAAVGALLRLGFPLAAMPMPH